MMNNNITIKIKFTSAFYYILLICSLFSFDLKAQHEKSLDSLYQLKTSIERTRGFMGSAEELKLTREQYINYMNDAEKLAISKNDKLLIEQLDFIRYNWKNCDSLDHSEKKITLKQISEQYKKKGKPLYTAHSLHYLALLHFEAKEYGLSYENYVKAYNIYKDIGFENVPMISKFLHDFALYHYFFKNYDEVIRLMHISAKLPPFNSNLHIQRYNNLGVSYTGLGVKDSALFYLEKTKELAEKYNSKTWEGITFSNVGNIYYQEKDYLRALEKYKKAYHVLKNNPIYTIKVSSYINITKTYIQMDSLQKTKHYLDILAKSFNHYQKKWSYGDFQNIQLSKKDYYDLKSRYLIKVKLFDEALIYKDSLFQTEKFLDSTYNSSIIKISSDKLAIQNKELQLAQKEREKTNQMLIYIGLIFLVCISGGISYFYLYKSKQKKKRQNERLITLNRISILEKQKTQKELEFAKKEINHFISKINEQNTIVSKFEEDLKKLKELESDDKKQVEKTLNLLKNTKILTDEDWKNFLDNFETVFPNFRILIKEKAPSITSSELRYLMLIKLNFTHKEMARTLGISDGAIRVTWNRVRKKLNGTLENTPKELLDEILEEKEIIAYN